MVNIRPLPASEAANLFPKRGGLDIAEYVQALEQFDIGDAAAVEVDGLSTRAIKRRMGSAAKQLGLSLKWTKFVEGDEIMKFQVRQIPTTRQPRARRNSRQLVTA